MKSIKSLVRSLDLDFSAKVRWRMRYDKTPLFITLQDKYRMREYAESRGVKTANLLYATDRPETIPFADLPPRYLIKANHGWNWNILCFDSELYSFGNGKELVHQDGSFLNMKSASRYELTRAQAIQTCTEWLTRTHPGREWAYQHVIPKILVEELLVSSDNQALKDYRMYTFHGVVKAINVGSAIFRRNAENVFFDPTWKEFTLTTYKEARPDPLPERPACLAEMIDVAQTLGEELDFARIDLYDTTQGVILGEITLYPQAGRRATPTSCPLFNQWLGDQWQLTRTDAVNAFCWNIASGVGSYAGRLVRKCRR